MSLKLLGFFLVISPLWAFQQQNETIYEEYQVSIKQVQVNVVDRDGKPVKDLTAEDFTVTLNGEPQPIESVIPISLDRIAFDAATAEEPTKADIPENGRRLFVLLFDVQYNTRRGLFLARKSAREFVENEMMETDLAAVFSITRDSLTMGVNFTNDPEQLLFAIDTLGYGGAFASTSGYASPEALRMMNRRQAFQDQADLNSIVELINETEFAGDFAPTVQALSRRSSRFAFSYLEVFRDFANALDAMEGRKNVVLFSQGFDMRGGGLGTNLRLMRMLIESLQASGSVVFAVDTAPTAPSASKIGLDPLNNIASTSGGRIYTNYNRYNGALERIEAATSNYYVLNVRPTISLPPGEIADMEVEVNRRRVEVIAPTGMVVNPDFERSNMLQQKFFLAEFMAKDRISSAIPISLQTLQAPGPDEDVRLSVISEIDQDYFLSYRQFKQTITLEMFTIVQDRETNRLLSEKFQTATIDGRAWALGDRRLSYFADVSLPPGRYKIKTVIRNLDDGQVGSMIRDVDLFQTNQPVTGPLAIETDPALVLRAMSDQKKAFPFFDGREPLVPTIRGSLATDRPSRFLYLVDGGVNAVNLRVTALLVATNGDLVKVPPSVMRTEFYRNGPDASSALVLSIDASGLDLEQNATYQLLTQIDMPNSEPVRQTLDVIVQ